MPAAIVFVAAVDFGVYMSLWHTFAMYVPSDSPNYELCGWHIVRRAIVLFCELTTLPMVCNMCIRLTRHVAIIVMHMRATRTMLGCMRRVSRNSGRTHKRSVRGTRNIDMTVR